MPNQVINGMDIHYELYGKGQPLILLHGFTATGKQWAPFIKELQAEYHLIVPDLPGHGRSAIPRGSFTHRMAAECMHELLNSLHVSAPYAMGFSAGGMTLVHMATQQPDRLQKIILWSSTTYFPKQCRELMSGVDPEKTTERELPWLVEHAGGKAQCKWVLEQFRSFKDSYDDMNFTPPLLSTIKANTLIIHGDRDEYFPVGIPLSLYDAIPNAFLSVFPNARHFFPEDAIPEVIRQCRAFFAGNWDKT